MSPSELAIVSPGPFQKQVDLANLGNDSVGNWDPLVCAKRR